MINLIICPNSETLIFSNNESKDKFAIKQNNLKWRIL
ncbi:hypothetical protein ThvES_00018130 [Thiovulum sp. ES]|jgi:hypothetical protein|nr:hypothetical protein ThvES_00018130 [Thiovulum sp. ES]